MEKQYSESVNVDDRATSTEQSTSTTTSSAQLIAMGTRALPDAALARLAIVRDHYGAGYLRFGRSSTLVRIDSPKLPALLMKEAADQGVRLELKEIREFIDYLKTAAQLTPNVQPVWLRIAETDAGVEIDLADGTDARVRVSPGKVEILPQGSETLFWRPSAMRALPWPAEEGNADLLDRYLNLSFEGRILLKAVITYWLAHGKVPKNSLLILVLGGDQGSGKSTLSRGVQRMVDNSEIEIQAFPKSGRDLAISVQSAFLTVYDNVRHIRPDMADLLCMVSTGGSITTRRLYTDAELTQLRLHGAVILNGIHSLLEQPDLAQRCVVLNLLPIDEADRRSERDLDGEFEADLPKIFRGLLDLIAEILAQLPSVEVTHPERMLDFVRWIAALEKVKGVPAGEYQKMYSQALKDAMLDSLLENPIAAAVLSFADEQPNGEWEGTPLALLHVLSDHVSRRASWSRDWPESPIALSKQLKSLQGGLRKHGIHLRWDRGKERRIKIWSTRSDNE